MGFKVILTLVNGLTSKLIRACVIIFSGTWGHLFGTNIKWNMCVFNTQICHWQQLWWTADTGDAVNLPLWSAGWFHHRRHPISIQRLCLTEVNDVEYHPLQQDITELTCKVHSFLRTYIHSQKSVLGVWSPQQGPGRGQCPWSWKPFVHFHTKEEPKW